jgi:hypothetical protein
MATYKPYYTSNDLVEAVERKCSIPLQQESITAVDVLKFASEEMMISQVPVIMAHQEEYFVYQTRVALRANTSRYPIPDRAIGMKVNDVFYVDASGNYNEMTRVDGGNKGFFQQSNATTSTLHKFYIEGNDIVLTPGISGTPSGSIAFFFYLRPNQLVPDERSCTIERFVKNITVQNNGSIVAGDTVTINDEVFTAVASGATGDQFNIGATAALTATNLAATITSNGVVTTATAASGVVTCKFSTLSLIQTFETSNTTSFSIPATTFGIEVDDLIVSYTDPLTNEVEDMFIAGSTIDVLQTNGGHKTHVFDIEISSVSGDIAYVDEEDFYTNSNQNNSTELVNLVVGDYICLANECIIPQIPSDLHTSLAERTCARILDAIGDMTGLTAKNQKIAVDEKRTSDLIDNRIDNSPRKVLARNGLLRRRRL